MKKITIVIAMLLGYYSFSQDNIKGFKVNNTIYIGITNYVKYEFPNYNSKYITAVAQDTSNVRVRKLDNYGDYKINVRRTGECIIKVYYNKTKLIGEYKYNINRIPLPMAKIGGKYDGLIKKSTLMLQPGIIASVGIPELDSYLKYKVVRYKVIVKDKIISVEGNKFTPEVKELIAKVGKGGTVIFDNIIVKGPDGLNKKVNIIVFKLN